MKQYTLTKLVCANSLAEAIAKEREGIILGGGLSDELTTEEYQAIIERKRKLKIGQDV